MPQVQPLACGSGSVKGAHCRCGWPSSTWSTTLNPSCNSGRLSKYAINLSGRVEPDIPRATLIARALVWEMIASSTGATKCSDSQSATPAYNLYDGWATVCARD